MIDLFNLNYIHWLILAVILIASEIIIPGVYVIWFGFSAAIVGGIFYFIPLNFTVQLGLFALFSVISIFIGVKVYKSKNSDIDSGTLNQVRGSEYIGQSFTTTTPVVNGSGRLHLGDTTWTIIGDDCPANTKIKIVDVAVNSLKYIILN